MVSLVKVEETIQAFSGVFVVLFSNDERPSWKSASPVQSQPTAFCMTLCRQFLCPGLCFELTNGAFFFSCEKWGGKSVSSQLGKSCPQNRACLGL